jgi:HlyD family secretion protein
VIFRKVALERLSSPEQLDQLLQVTNPRGWLALGALGALLLVAVIWGVFGSVPTTAEGGGILIRQGGVASLVSTASGQVEEILVAVGQVIAKGQVVAKVRQQGLQLQLADARAKRADLAAQYQQLLRVSEEQKRLKARDLAQQRANLERSIAASEKDVALRRERLAAEEELLKDGLITKQELLTTQQGLNAARDQLAGQQLERNGLELKRLESEQQLDQQLESRKNAIQDLELQIREDEAKLKEDVSILSPHAGRVLELAVARGDLVNPGTAVLNLEVVSEDLMAVIFVPASTGKQVQPGMAVRLSPSTVKREEYGYMLGRVSWVAEFPSTQRGMVRLLGNEALVAKLMAAGPPIQVNVALRRDRATPTGYRWSSSRGPSLKISSGTLADGSIVVRADRPVALVIPTLREKLGV